MKNKIELFISVVSTFPPQYPPPTAKVGQVAERRGEERRGLYQVPTVQNLHQKA